MNPADTGRLLGLATKVLTQKAVERAHGGWIPEKQRIQQQRQAVKAQEKQKKESEKRSKLQDGGVPDDQPYDLGQQLERGADIIRGTAQAQYERYGEPIVSGIRELMRPVQEGGGPESYQNPEMVGRALDVVGGMGAGSLALGAKQALKEGIDPSVMRIFAGPTAKTADKDALNLAQQMEHSGESVKNIWDQTGWFKGADDKWRFEIPDDLRKVSVDYSKVPERLDRWKLATEYFEGKGIPAAQMSTTKYLDLTKEAYDWADKQIAQMDIPTAPLGTVMQHPDLYEAYPQLKDIPVRKEIAAQYKGSYNPYSKDMSLSSPKTYASSYMQDELNDKVLPVALHESQHAVQDIEGFAKGANIFGLKPNTPAWDIYERIHKNMSTAKPYEDFLKEAGYDADTPAAQSDYKNYVKSTKKITPELDRMAQETAVQEAYRRSAGEVEAKNVEQRLGMSLSALKANPPWETQKIPKEEQIVTFHNPEGEIEKPKFSGGALQPQNLKNGGRVYPLADRDQWKLHHLEKDDSKLVHMEPDEFLDKAQKLEDTKENKKDIKHWKKKIKKGDKLGPAALYTDGSQDGRHRVEAAKKMGIKKVPVLTWPERGTEPAKEYMKSATKIARKASKK